MEALDSCFHDLDPCRMVFRMSHTLTRRGSANLPPQQRFSSPCPMISMPAWSRQEDAGEHRPLLMPRVAVLFLLLALAGLSTLAKYTPYLPKTNPAHYVNPATKMKVAQAPALFDQTPLQAVATVVPPRPNYRPRRQDQPPDPPIQRIGLTVSYQHRSPPALLA